MTRLTLSLALLTFLFWGGHLLYYFRVQIYKWVDNRVSYEPAVERLRAWFRQGRR